MTLLRDDVPNQTDGDGGLVFCSRGFGDALLCSFELAACLLILTGQHKADVRISLIQTHYTSI